MALLLSVAAWTILVARPHKTDWATQCASITATGWDRVEQAVAAAWRLGAAPAAIADWGLMSLAMVPVLALPMVRFVAARSFVQRRARAVAEFLVGSLAVWLLAGGVLIPVLILSALPDVPHAIAGSTAFALAALWQLTPAKRTALQRCHRTTALAASGWQADWDCMLFGMQSAVPCVITCWGMMLACAVTSHSVAALLLVQGIAMHERAVQAPRVSRYAFLLAAGAAMAALAPAVLP